MARILSDAKMFNVFEIKVDKCQHLLQYSVFLYRIKSNGYE